MSLTNKSIRTYFTRDKEKGGSEELGDEAMLTEQEAVPGFKHLFSNSKLN